MRDVRTAAASHADGEVAAVRLELSGRVTSSQAVESGDSWRVASAALRMLVPWLVLSVALSAVL